MVGEVERLGAWRIERGSEDGGGGRPEDTGDGLLVLSSAACSTGVRNGERGGENGHDSVRIRTVQEHDGRGSSARRVATPTSMAGGALTNRGCTVPKLNSFE
mgnify:CR=1 FL=1